MLVGKVFVWLILFLLRTTGVVIVNYYVIGKPRPLIKFLPYPSIRAGSKWETWDLGYRLELPHFTFPVKKTRFWVICIIKKLGKQTIIVLALHP